MGLRRRLCGAGERRRLRRSRAAFNSWDAIPHPRRLLTRVGRYLVAERRYREAAACALSFSAVLICVYLVVALPLLS